MTKKTSLLKSLLVLAVFLLPIDLRAQSDVGDLFKSSPQDATKLVGAYMNPLFKGMGLGLNSGWTNTAKTKRFLRFDLRVSATAAFVPTEDQSYNTNSLGLQTISPVLGENGIGPTAFGSDVQGSRMQINGAPPNSPDGQFNLPQGTGIKFAPTPQVQLTVGLPKNIDVTLRLVPNISLGNDIGKINQFGLGAKVELLPLIMGKKDKLIPFDLALALGFTNTTYTLPLDINNGKYTNQEVEVKFKGFNAEAIISRKLLFFTPFASIGYNSSNSRLNAFGTYEFDAPTISNPKGTQTFTDPIALKAGEISGLKASLGFQLNLAFLRVYASYTAAAYSYANAGIGFGFGK